MRKLVITAASLVVLTVSGADAVRAEAAESEDCCWLYCESYRMICERSLGEDEDYCQAFYEGCIDGCRYPDG